MEPASPSSTNSADAETSDRIINSTPILISDADPVPERPVIVRIDRNLSSNRPPAFIRYNGVEQRSELWRKLRPGKLINPFTGKGMRKGSSGVGDPAGAGIGPPADFAVMWALQGESNEDNMFTRHGNKYEPCVRLVLEHVTGLTVYDGGYWVPVDEGLRELLGDSPDAVFVMPDDDTGNLYIVGVGEMKAPISMKTFQEGRVCLAHVMQCHIHMHATGSGQCYYLALHLNDKPHGVYSDDFPEIDGLLYAVIHYSDEFLKLILQRVDLARRCAELIAQYPESPVVPGWGMMQYNGNTVSFIPQCVASLIPRRTIQLQIEYIPVDYHRLNAIGLLKSWKNQKHPDGLPWEAVPALWPPKM